MRGAGQTAIVGIGQTEFSKNSGRSELQLAAESIKMALDDAGLTPADVDGLITFTLDGSDEIGVGRCLGIPDLKFATRLPNGGAASVATVFHAMSAVASGVCDVVVIWRAMNERSQYRFGQPLQRGAIPTGGGSTFMEWCLPYGAQSPASWEALTAQSYMSRFGVTNEDFGRVSVVLRKHAATNPAAWFYGKPITLEDHQASRWIVAPSLRLLDCCQESDGGVAIVVTSTERARDLKQKPVTIRGAVTSTRFNHEIISDYYATADLSQLEIGDRVRERLTQVSGIAPKDTQVAMIYDNFTPQIYMQLEAFGYCGPGEAKDYIKDGNLELTGRSPLSPNGGHIGEGYIHGMNLITEGVRQARGTAANQVANVENVFLGSGVAGAIIGAA
jgi:acetyl-CoA acetyltransferase